MSPRPHDAIIIGGGIIGLSLALELRKSLSNILVLDKGPLGRESTYAAAGMLNASDCKGPAAFRQLADSSAHLYPSFVQRLEAESGLHVDFQRTGTLVMGRPPSGKRLSAEEIRKLEPELTVPQESEVHFIQEDFVEPRSLLEALKKCASKSQINVEEQNVALEVLNEKTAVTGIRTQRRPYSAAVIVNCAGAWAGEIRPLAIPSRPVKGQMVALQPAATIVRHVVRDVEQDFYMLPRESGVIAIGATVEDAGFDKTVDDKTEDLRRWADDLFPSLIDAPIRERWAGLRPGTPDNLPILGETEVGGYYVATGHYRSGILLAPATAQVMAELILKGKSSIDLTPFTLSRFAAGVTDTPIY